MATVEAPSIYTWAARSRGWIALLVLSPFAAAVLFSKPIALEGSWPDFGFDAAGWVLFFMGAATRWWATLYIGTRKTKTLVTEGPYSICRNPLYVGTFLMGLAVAAFLGSLTFAVGLLLTTGIYLSTTVSVEERKLRSIYGHEYAGYCEAVPRFIPRFKNFNTPATIQVNARGLFVEGVRTARWIWLPVICELIAQLRSQPSWPYYFHLP